MLPFSLYSIAVLSAQAYRSADKTSSSTGRIVLSIVLLILFVGGAIFLYVRKHSDRGYWEDKSKTPHLNASVVKVKTDKDHLGKNDTRYRTNVTFSDGYVFTTVRTKVQNHAFSYTISMDSKLMGEILQIADRHHTAAVIKRCKKEGAACDPASKKPLTFSGVAAPYAKITRVVESPKAEVHAAASTEKVNVSCPMCGAKLSFPKDYYDSNQALICTECFAKIQSKKK